jgi:hypothetical protein
MGLMYDALMPSIDLSRGWTIASQAADPVSRLASSELEAAFSALAPAQGAARELRVGLSHDAGDGEGYRWEADRARGIALHGEGPRGLLYGVYDLLHAAGFRWLSPAGGSGWDRRPAGPVIEVPALRSSSPGLPGRCLIIGHEVFLRQAVEWIAWAGRSRLNTVFFHIIDEPLAMGAASAARYRSVRDKAVAAARERGMRIEVGGHGMSLLLPRRCFRKTPQAFRMSEGSRTPDHNFCPSSPEAREIISANSAKLFRLYPEADVIHSWADDIPGGGWCSCPKCADLSVSDQALMATNILADALKECLPGAQISHLAYQDTENVPARTTPRPNVCLLWAPRMRCYAHGADEPGCAENALHCGPQFRTLNDFFRRSGAQPSRVFEYYLDTILFPAVIPFLPGTLAKDMRFYRDAGAHTVQALMTGSTAWAFPPLNAWLYPRLAWDPDQDPAELAGEFFTAALGVDAARASAGTVEGRRLAASLEAAHAAAIDIVPEQVLHRLPPTPLAAVSDPSADMTDPAHAPSPVLKEKVLRLEVIPALLDKAGESLEAMRALSAPHRWEAARIELDLHRAVLQFERARARLYEAAARGAARAEVRVLLSEARGHAGEVVRWSRRTMSVPADRREFRLLLEVLWGLRLSFISREYAVTPLGRGLSWCITVIRLALMYLRVRRVRPEG